MQIVWKLSLLLSACLPVSVAAEPERIEPIPIDPAVADTGRIDLTKIERALVKEPKYGQPRQEYCLLVFGPKADLHVWLVRDGDTLHVDRNGNGDLTEPGEAFRREDWYSLGDLTARDGKRYTSLRAYPLSDGYRVAVTVPEHGPQIAGIVVNQRPKFAAQAKDAPIIHFGGPLAITQFSTDREIAKSGQASARDLSLRIMVGTSGLGAGTFAAYNCRVCDKLGPLVAKFEFSSDRGGPPIAATSELTKIG